MHKQLGWLLIADSVQYRVKNIYAHLHSFFFSRPVMHALTITTIATCKIIFNYFFFFLLKLRFFRLQYSIIIFCCSIIIRNSKNLYLNLSELEKEYQVKKYQLCSRPLELQPPNIGQPRTNFMNKQINS